MSTLPQRSNGGLSKNEGGTLRTGARLPAPEAPNGAVIGDLWYDTTNLTLNAWDGETWRRVLTEVGSNSIATSGLAYVGTHPVHGGNNWAAFGNIDRQGANDYAFMQDSAGRTLVNASSGQNITFLINGGQVGIFESGGQLKVQDAKLGNWPWDGAWSMFGHSNCWAHDYKYAFMSHSEGEIIVNSRNDKNIYLRRNVITRFQVIGGEVSSVGVRFIVRDWGSWNGYHAEKSLQIVAGGNYIGASFWNSSEGVAPQIMVGIGWGERLNCMTNPNGGGLCPIAASAFEVNSTMRFKSNIRTLEKGAKDKIKKMRPVRFKRAHTKCANCHGQGEISPADYIEHVYGNKKTDETPQELLEPQPCPTCSNHGTPGLINTPVTDLNIGKDFLSFAAEEMVDAFPEAVVYGPSVEGDAMSAPRPEGIDMMALLTLTIAAVQELDDRLDVLEGPKEPKGPNS